MSNIDTASYNRQGKVFHAANVAAASFKAVDTTPTGLILCNPFGSGRKFIIVDGGFVWTTAGAAAHQVGWAVGFSQTQVTHTAALVVYAADGSGVGSASVAKVDDSATVPTIGQPTSRRWFGGSLGAAVSPYMVVDKPEGALVLVPGAYIHFASVTTTLVGMGSMTWIEVPA